MIKLMVFFLCLSFDSLVIAADFSVIRFYSPVDGYISIVIETNADMRIKCAVYDQDENALRVIDRHISKPLDEVTLSTGIDTELVSGVNCWETR